MGLVLGKNNLKLIDDYIASGYHAVVLSYSRDYSGLDYINYLANKIVVQAKEELHNSPNTYIINSESKSIGVDGIRDAKDFVKLKAHGHPQSNRAIVIIGADRMTREAQNALLKLLEEPPANVFLILSTDCSWKLIDTIKSRSHVLTINPPLVSEIVTGLKDAYDIEDINKAISLTSGYYEQVLEFLSPDRDKSVDELAKHIIQSSLYARMIEVDRLNKDKNLSICVVESLIKILMLASKTEGRSDKERLRMISAAKRAINSRDSLNNNANTKLVLTDLFLSL